MVSEIFQFSRFRFPAAYRSFGTVRMAGVILAVLALLLVGGCSKAVKPTSPEDIPKNHYEAGLKLIDDKDPAKPEAEFKRAVVLDKRSPYGHAGLAALEYKRQNWKKAVQHADKALKRDRKFTDASIVKARALIALKRSKWLDRTQDTLRRVLEYDSQNERALYYLGEASLIAYRFEDALAYFRKAAERKGPLASEAAGRADLASRTIAVQPRGESGRRIALSPSVTRTEVCSLLLDEFHLKDVLKSRRLTFFEAIYGNDDKRTLPRDIELRKDSRTILDVAVLNLPSLRVFPNEYFYPDRPVNRAQFAMILQEIIVLLYDDQTISTRYAESESPFLDVRPDYYAFNAIMIAVDRGIMPPASGAEKFGTDGVVRGIEALEMMRSLEAMIAGS